MRKNIDLKSLLQKSNANYLNQKVISLKINSALDLEKSNTQSISFFSNVKYLELLKKTKAKVVITTKDLLKYVPKKKFVIIAIKPEIEFAKILNYFYPESYYSKISYENLSISLIKKKYKNIKFGINFYLENNVQIGKNVLIGNNVTIKKNCVIGNNVIIGSNVIIENSLIADDVHICDGSIIGKKGFGFKFVDKKCVRIPHMGRVIIEQGCEIGANCVLDRGSVKDTIIGKNTFLDNFVHIAHNVILGENCILAAQVGIAGSSKVGNNVIIGGQAGISGHLQIGNNVKIGGKTGVIKNIKDNEVVMGYPAKPLKEFIKNNR